MAAFHATTSPMTAFPGDGVFALEGRRRGRWQRTKENLSLSQLTCPRAAANVSRPSSRSVSFHGGGAGPCKRRVCPRPHRRRSRMQGFEVVDGLLVSVASTRFYLVVTLSIDTLRRHIGFPRMFHATIVIRGATFFPENVFFIYSGLEFTLFPSVFTFSPCACRHHRFCPHSFTF